MYHLKMIGAFVLCCMLLSQGLSAAEIKGKAPVFKLKTLGSDEKSLADFKGQVVLLNFWASWCGPCRKELPILEAIHKKYKNQGFSVVGVNIDEETHLAKAQLTKTPVTFPNFLDPASKVSAMYKVDAMPSTVIIDRKGNMRYLHRGYKPGYETDYIAQVKKLIRE